MEVTLGKKYTRIVERFILEVLVGGVRRQASENMEYLENVPGFLIAPEAISVHWFNDHIAISYDGDESAKSLKITLNPVFKHVLHFDESATYPFSSVLGLDLPKSQKDDPLHSRMSLGVISISRRGLLFCDTTFSELADKGWRMGATDSTGVILGFQECPVGRSEGFNFQNVFVFSRSANQEVATNRIKWLDVIPYCVSFDSGGEISGVEVSQSRVEKTVLGRR
ncbi:hypothetical protein PSYAE_24967 [Pseudomonas amygdali pv. aesculi str. 0893_23]|uniref:hypothetical protein n=1 Tax=Pseudomonas syringae group genomosp. 2 TaxID=251698 RepID=UPI0001CC4266|nr:MULTISPECIES: hypothetical protein [Pseudomonas syringae group genomosp. 2]EGH05154.1 hypothetical protein PSYAE_24967 [Pseudomonas amygdali pv. aesculi str. 0893_23]KPW07696.1 hypothetical protein ALO90_200037 [Pseudomonas amygdali pv. aesculi]MCQ3013592.1 hypothetical protein [Pseudomonas savastanoi]